VVPARTDDFLLTVMATGEPSEALRGSLESHRDQAWELIAVDSGNSEVDRFGQALSRSQGSHLMLLDRDDVLHASAVSAIRSAAAHDVDLIVADDDGSGPRPFRKPATAPEWLRSQNYLAGATTYRMDRVRELGDAWMTAAASYELALRIGAAASPGSTATLRDRLLLTRRPARRLDADEMSATRAALEAHLARTGGGRVVEVRDSGRHDTRRDVVGEPLVSIVIPTRGSRAIVRGEERVLVVEAVRSVITRTSYLNYEFVFVVDAQTPDAVRADLRALVRDRGRFVEWDAPFSFSGKMNLGALRSSGDFLVLLNDDVEVITEDWLSAMLALGQRPSAGIVGAILFFEDDTIQHAGHVYSAKDVTHIGLGWPRGAEGPNGELLIEREVTGVTAACALIAREAFLAVGGFSDLLPLNFNDVDLCMKLAARGYQAYVTPRAQLYHFESRTRDPRVVKYETDLLWRRWGRAFGDERFWRYELDDADTRAWPPI